MNAKENCHYFHLMYSMSSNNIHNLIINENCGVNESDLLCKS